MYAYPFLSVPTHLVCSSQSNLFSNGGWGPENYYEDSSSTFGRSDCTFASSLASSSLLNSSLSLLIAQTRIVSAEDRLTLKSVKVFDARLLEHCR